MSTSKKWFCEGTVPGKRIGKIKHCFLMEKVVLSERTKYQKVLIFDNPIYGRVLVLDDIVQLSEKDEYIYAEMITQPLLFNHPNPKKVLIIGGGDGGTLREVLRHDVEEVHMVEIDRRMIEIAKKYLAFCGGKAFEDKRAKLHIEDGSKFIKQFKEYFDLVIIDSSDPVGPSQILYSAPFYKDVRACLAKDGMAMFQIGSFLDFENLVLKTYNRAKAIFPHVAIYRFTIPCYHCGDYCFIGVSKKLNICNPELGVLEARSKGFQFNFYSANMHLNSLALPAIYQKKIK